MTLEMRSGFIAVSLLVGLSASPALTEQQVEVATTVAFTEGPAVDRDGTVYFTDIINQRIMTLGADGVLSTYRQNSNVANGLLIDPQGRLIACEGAAFERPGVKLAGLPRVTRTDLKTGQMDVLADRYDGKPLVGPNDVTIDYITNNAFGGPDMKTLYVTAGKTLYKVRTDIAGLPR